MTDSGPSLVTGAMLGMFLAFGVDTIVIVGALWYVGMLSATVAGGVSAAVLGVFLLWIAARWVRLRRRGRYGADVDGTPAAVDAGGDATGDESDPVERLKRRYADGEVSDEEFEARLERLLDVEESPERAREPEFEPK